MRGIVLALLLLTTGLSGCIGADVGASSAPPDTVEPSATAPFPDGGGSGSSPVAVWFRDCRQVVAEIPFPEDAAPGWSGFEREPYEGDPSGATAQVDGFARECTLVGSGETVRELWALGRVDPPDRYKGEEVDRYYALIGGVTTSQRLADAYEAWGFSSVGHGNVSFSLEEVQAVETGSARGVVGGTDVSVNTTVPASSETREPVTARVFGFQEGEVTGAVDLTWGKRGVAGPGNAVIRLSEATPPVFEGRAFHARGFPLELADAPAIPPTRAGATSSGSWLQIGGDAGRTGALAFEGPRTNDTVMELQLPGVPVIQPVVVDGSVYVGTIESSINDHTTENGVWRVDLATGEVEELLDLGNDIPYRVRPDHVVIVEEEELVARSVPSGDERWRVKPLGDDPHPERLYWPVATVGSALYVPFAVTTSTGDTTTGGIMAVDVRSGEELWTWTRGTSGGEEAPASDRVVNDIRVSADEDGVYPYFKLDVSYGTTNCALNQCVGEDVDRTQYELWALTPDGEYRWKRNDTDRKSVEATNPVTGSEELTAGPLSGEWGSYTGGKPVVTPESVHIRLDTFQRFNPATGEVLWSSSAGRSDQLQAQGAYGMGVRGSTLIGLSPQTVTRLDALTGSIVWQRTDPGNDRVYSVAPVGIDEDTAYVPVIPSRSDSDIGLDAVDLETGAVRWTWEPSYQNEDVGSIPGFPAYGPGFVVWGVEDGTLFVVGETDASLGEPEARPSTIYPDPGEEVRVDLSNTSPGAFGNATRYMVYWGDGTVTGWQRDPAFTHTYNGTGDVEARFVAGNDANQTASTFRTFHVGEDPPQDPTFLQTAFARKNQDLTFGVLGIIIAAIGAVVGATQRYRKRTRLQDELAALERGFEDTRNHPAECEAFLDERKAHARSLVLDGVLNEEQLAIVQDRSEELRRELRATAVTDEFGFLPHALVRKAREMLEDGRVTSLEAEAFLAALEEVEILSSTQRAAVRERIEEWFARDTGGGGG